MRRAVIFGAAAFAEVARVYLDADSPFTVEGFTVHQRFIGERTSLRGLPVLPFERLHETHSPADVEIFVALGYGKMNRTRAAVVEEVRERGYRLLTYVNSNVRQVGQVEIGENCFLFENNVIQPFVSIGDNTILWSGNHVGHHSRIGKNCFIASQVVISGNCTIGDNCFIGVNATLRDDITVAPECIIGAGALILTDTVLRGVYRARASERAKISSDELPAF